MNGVQTRFKCKLDVKRCKRFVFPPSSLLPRSNALKTKAIRYFQTDRTLTRIVSPPLTVAPDYGTFALRVNDKVITPEINLTNEEVSLLLVNLGQVNLKKGENELQIESAALASGHDTGFFGIDKLTLRK